VAIRGGVGEDQPVSAATPLEAAFEIVRSRSHGHVAAVLGTARRLELDRRFSPRPLRDRHLVLAMVVARLLDPRSKLATARGRDPETPDEHPGRSARARPG
jgi:hypothetical protein